MADEALNAEIILYQSEGSNVPVEVRYQDETMWMPQAQIAELFDTSQQNVSLHLKNIYETGELDEAATYKKILLVRQEGSRTVNRAIRAPVIQDARFCCLISLSTSLSWRFDSSIVNASFHLQIRSWTSSG